MLALMTFHKHIFFNNIHMKIHKFDILTCNNLVEPSHIEQPSSIVSIHNTLTSNIIHENILTTLENPSPHHDKYFQQLLDTPIHPFLCYYQLRVFFFNKENIKIHDSKILFTCFISRKKSIIV